MEPRSPGDRELRPWPYLSPLTPFPLQEETAVWNSGSDLLG